MFRIKLFLPLVVATFFTLFAGLAWAVQPAPDAATGFDGGKMGAGAAGSMHTYRHLLSNHSGQPQSFHLAATSNKGFTVSVSQPTVILENGQSASVNVRVTIPSGTPPGTLDITTLTAMTEHPTAPIRVTVQDSTLASTDTPLHIPPQQTGHLIDGQRVYTLTMANSSTAFWPGVDTPTAGYNGSYLAPTLVMTANERILVHVTNHMTVTTTTHWHGFHLPAEMDGGPHQGIKPGTTWSPTWTVLNEASTLWYHPHPHPHDGHGGGSTGIQVYQGLAGMALIRDAKSNALGLPQRYGVDEFPLILQDRAFHEDGSFDMSYNQRGQRKGDAFLVNGTLAGHLSAPAQMVRFHLLNGSNFRFYNLGFSDNRRFYQIASDNALLNAPVARTRVQLAPGERIEIVADLRNARGQTLHLANYGAEWEAILAMNQAADEYDQANFVLFSLDVRAPTANPVTSLPGTLNNIVRVPRAVARAEHRLTLQTPAISGATFDMEVVNITSTLDTMEIWSIINLTDEPHPIHIHDSPFQILVRDAPLPVEGEPLPAGGVPPAAHERGWKDTVIVKAGERVDLIKGSYDFADLAAPFMYHCHLLEHEDAGMMGQFVVAEGAPEAEAPIQRDEIMRVEEVEESPAERGNAQDRCRTCGAPPQEVRRGRPSRPRPAAPPRRPPRP